MLARLPRRNGDGDAQGDMREARTRKVARVEVRHWVLISSMTGQEAEATIRDISTHGCNVRSEAGWLRLGSFISIRLQEEESVMGIVRWIRDGSAGIEFLRPLLPGQEAWIALIDVPS